MNIEEKARKYVNKTFAQANEWEKEKIIHDWLKKERKTKGLIDDFERRAGKIKGKRILELGFGSGLQMLTFANSGAIMSGLEVNEELYKIAKEVLEDIHADISMYNGKHFPYEDNQFDFCYATSVLEHVSDLETVLREVLRILKPGGRFYLSFPNRWWPKETHTGIYFLSFLPRKLASLIVRKIFRRNTVDEWNLHFLSYLRLKKTLKQNGISFKIILEVNSPNFLKRIIKKTLASLGIHHSALLRTVMVVLEKPMTGPNELVTVFKTLVL